MRHLIAPSSMFEIEPTSIHSSSQKGLHTQHPRLSRSRRDTPSSPSRLLTLLIAYCQQVVFLSSRPTPWRAA
jgi:hypothetical protein